MLPRLEAEESIAAVNRIACGTGAAEASLRVEMLRHWHATVRGERRTETADRPRRTWTPEALKDVEASAAAHGIGYRLVPKQKKAGDGQH